MTQEEPTTIDRIHGPEVTMPRAGELPPVERITLPNGVDVIIYDHCHQDVNQIMVTRRGGLAELNNAAAARLLAEMPREGAGGMSGAEIADRLDYNGTWLKSAITPHHLTHTFFSLNSSLSQVLPVITAIVDSPDFPEKELRVRSHVAAQALMVDMESEAFYARTRMSSMLMGSDHPLAGVPTPEQIESVDRSVLVRHHEMWRDPRNLTVIVAGRIDSMVRHMVIEAFSTLESCGSESKGLNIVPFAPSGEHDSYVERPGALQTSVRVAVPLTGLTRENPDYLPLHIATHALGGYFGSRLMSDLREECGYTYGVRASLLGYAEGTLLTVNMECDNAYAADSVEHIRRQIESLATVPANAAEIERIQRSIISDMTDTLDSPFTIAGYLNTAVTMPLPDDYFERRMRLTSELTPEAITSVAARYLVNAPIYTSLAGDRGDAAAG